MSCIIAMLMASERSYHSGQAASFPYGIAWFAALALLACLRVSAAAPPGIFNVRDLGAKGDGRALDTAALNRAVEACAAAGGGQVLFPPGKYLTGTIHLKSHVTLKLDAGAADRQR
jgi:polygalacturonase